MTIKKHLPLLLFSLIFILPSTVTAGKLYRWVDDNGKVSFSDKVPPKHSRKEHRELNELGRTIAIKDAAKTPEQIELLKRINTLQKTQQKLLNKQLARDSALLKTFRSTTDIDALAESKSNMVKSHITIASSQSETLKSQLILHQKVAANFERKGKNIPQKKLDNIKSAQSQFDKNQREIAALKIQKTLITKQLIKDKVRFNALLKQPIGKPSIHQETIPSLVLGELSCTPSNCDTLWNKALTFIKQQGSVVIYTSSSLALSKTPNSGKDRGLSLTKLTKNEQSQIILDIRCADSTAGKATCKSSKNNKIVHEFLLLSP